MKEVFVNEKQTQKDSLYGIMYKVSKEDVRVVLNLFAANLIKFILTPCQFGKNVVI